MASFLTKLPLSLLLLIITIITSSIPTTSSTPRIGITINHHPPSTTPESLAATITRLKITSVRLIDPDPNLIRSFSYSSVSLLLSIPNHLIPSLASNLSYSALWLYTHVIPFYPRSNITTISVGTDILSSPSDLSHLLLPAIRNLHLTLHQLGIRSISVSSTFSFIPLLSSVFPPSSSEFIDPVNDLVIRPLLDFLHDSNSSFLVNLYPYDVFRLNQEIVLGYALFQDGPFMFMDDTTTGVRYKNLFDTMVDSVLSAMAVSGHENIPLIVTGTGWPSFSMTDDDSYANQVYAGMYLKGLIRHLKSGSGTPLKKDGVSEVYVYELLDRDQMSKGNNSISSSLMRQWGILYPNLTSKYELDFSGCARIGGSNGFLMVVHVCLMILVSALL